MVNLIIFTVGLVSASLLAPAERIVWKRYRIFILIAGSAALVFGLILGIAFFADRKNGPGFSYAFSLFLLQFIWLYSLGFYVFFRKELLVRMNRQTVVSFALAFWYVFAEAQSVTALNRSVTLSIAALVMIFLTGYLYILANRYLKNVFHGLPALRTGIYMLIFLCVYMVSALTAIFLCIWPAWFSSPVPLAAAGGIFSLLLLFPARFIHTLWFLIILIALSVYNIRSFDLHGLFAGKSAVRPEYFLAGMVLFYGILNALKLLTFFPVPDAGKDNGQRLEHWRLRITETLSCYNVQEPSLPVLILISVLQAGSFYCNYRWRVVSVWLLVDAWLVWGQLSSIFISGSRRIPAWRKTRS